MATALPPPEAISEDYALALAEQAGLVIPPACLPGIVANLTLLAEHTSRFSEEATPS